MLLCKSSFAFLAYLGAFSTTARAQTPLPTVDLGYELHQAIAFNTTGNYYSFNNIRYAAPPTGDLRFRAPVPPATNRSVVQNGAQSRICIQALPSWIRNTTWTGDWLSGRPVTITQGTVTALNDSLTTANVQQLAGQASTATEDCLFLDVLVPKGVYDNGLKNKSGSAVMVWIYGGGYTFGNKNGDGNPAGLLQRSMAGGRNGVIYVAMNYRLGAFGWLAGPTVQADGVANAGLYDQRMALQWVQSYIHLFGGDPKRVTVFGESAGGGSIMHQITAYAGNPSSPAPFHQAIIQSPGFLPQTCAASLEAQYQTFLNLSNATSIAQLRTLPASTLITANSLQVWRSHIGQFTYGPVVDGTFAPALPGALLKSGKFDKSVRVMVGHNSQEGLTFASPLVKTADDFVPFLHSVLPLATDDVVNYIAGTLYPPVFDGSYGYKDQIGRSALFESEWIFTCNTVYLDKSKGNITYSYYFAVPPGTHGLDVGYTYYNYATPGINATIATTLQDYLVTYAMAGAPSSRNFPAPVFPKYGAGASVMKIDARGVSLVMDPAANYRCTWWQKGLYT